MAEQWIDAEQALKIAGDPISLCTRLSNRMITARAQKLTMDGQEFHNVEVPLTFWWAKGHEALEQDWSSGDFYTWTEHKMQVSAFGVRFPLSTVLEMVAFEKRAIIARSLSVSGSPDWISAMQARSLMFDQFRYGSTSAGSAIIEQARLGFVTARAVLAQGSMGNQADSNWSWEEREWNVPTWFWTGFTGADQRTQNWELGRFSGRGLAPDQTRWITLSDVHFHRASLNSLDTASAQVEAVESNRGRKPKFDWPSAINACWGRLYRGEPPVQSQSEVERMLISILRTGDIEPGESTVRPYASQIWAEFTKP